MFSLVEAFLMLLHSDRKHLVEAFLMLSYTGMVYVLSCSVHRDGVCSLL